MYKNVQITYRVAQKDPNYIILQGSWLLKFNFSTMLIVFIFHCINRWCWVKISCKFWKALCNICVTTDFYLLMHCENFCSTTLNKNMHETYYKLLFYKLMICKKWGFLWLKTYLLRLTIYHIKIAAVITTFLITWKTLVYLYFRVL